MRAPTTLMQSKGPHNVTQKMLAGVLVASLAFIVVVVLISRPKKTAPAAAAVASRLTLAEAEATPDEASNATADFLERIALSHLATPKAGAAGETGAATGEVSGDSTVPAPPKRRAATQTRTGKERVAANAPAGAPKDPASPQPALAAGEPAPDIAEHPNALQYGMKLVGNVGDFVVASDKRVIEGMASVGDALTSFVKKWKS
jgi:hypothetical protein